MSSIWTTHFNFWKPIHPKKGQVDNGTVVKDKTYGDGVKKEGNEYKNYLYVLTVFTKPSTTVIPSKIERHAQRMRKMSIWE